MWRHRHGLTPYTNGTGANLYWLDEPKAIMARRAWATAEPTPEVEPATVTEEAGPVRLYMDVLLAA